MPREPKEATITNCLVQPDRTAGWVRTAGGSAVPTRMQALLHLDDPRVAVRLEIAVSPGGRALVRNIEVTPLGGSASITTTLLRKVPVDFLMRAALDWTTVQTRDRPDIEGDAFQLVGAPDDMAWVSPMPPPSGRGREVPEERVARAAEAYQQALASGSKSPAEDVAAVMGYSRATAARDLRAAREKGLLASPEDSRAAPQSDPSDPLLRVSVKQDHWVRLSEVSDGTNGVSTQHE
ncbi:hypothetical protein ACFWIB_11020 [Streptomyces sp. NPDC127051]|uniref:hypothetical protein n=1 Tax=Streptomyces sp. NPDC127051 TaxID=3347119 RepID=UPI003652E114